MGKRLSPPKENGVVRQGKRVLGVLTQPTPTIPNSSMGIEEDTKPYLLSSYAFRVSPGLV